MRPRSSLMKARMRGLSDASRSAAVTSPSIMRTRRLSRARPGHPGRYRRRSPPAGGAELARQPVERMARHRLQEIGDRREVVGEVALAHARGAAHARLGELAALGEQLEGGLDDAAADVHGLVILPKNW